MMARGKIKEGGNARFYGQAAVVSVYKEMRAFDRLPPVLRAALREATSDSTATGWTKSLKVLGPDRCARGLGIVCRMQGFEFLEAEFGIEAARQITGYRSAEDYGRLTAAAGERLAGGEREPSTGAPSVAREQRS